MIKLIKQLIKENIWKAVLTGFILSSPIFNTNNNIKLFLINLLIITTGSLIACVSADFIKYWRRMKSEQKFKKR